MSSNRGARSVFTENALQACLEVPNGSSWVTGPIPEGLDEAGVVLVERDSWRFFFYVDDRSDARRLCLVDSNRGLSDATPPVRRAALERAHRFALEAAAPPAVLPPSWAPWREENRAAFYACPREFGAYRWIVEANPKGSHDVCFWELYHSDREIRLDRYAPEWAAYDAAVGAWPHAFAEAMPALAALEPRRNVEGVESTVDLEAATFGAVTQHTMYSGWLPRLTAAQRRFVEEPLETSIKLRGPAGSGKTLSLELKALKELYAARHDHRTLRVLFATHSWSMAEQVDAALAALDESGDLSGVDVYPLLSMADLLVPHARTAANFQILGEDSFSGKALQLEKIGAVLEAAASGDWLVYEGDSSAAFRERVRSRPRSPEWNALVWDLMAEFGSVLSANGILPGINAERRYLQIPRTLWMMPLETEADRRFVLALYSRYVDELREEGFLSSDQVVNDLLNYLETFAWNIRRRDIGYDLILVDELHLFSEQERLVLHYLARDPERYPRLVMALDPRQSPAEVYVEVDPRTITRPDSGLAEEGLGSVEQMELGEIHRFTPEILELVRHINHAYPALELGEEWNLTLDSVQSMRTSGEVPTITEHGSRTAEIAAVVEGAGRAADAVGREGRVAVVVLESRDLQAFVNGTRDVSQPRFVVVAGRDDVTSLQYSRRSVVLSTAEYVAGLQFEHVIVCGFPEMRTGAHAGHVLRRFLSLLYLAVSRARSKVEIHVNDEAGGVPSVLEAGLQTGVIAHT